MIILEEVLDLSWNSVLVLDNIHQGQSTVPVEVINNSSDCITKFKTPIPYISMIILDEVLELAGPMAWSMKTLTMIRTLSSRFLMHCS